MAAVLLHATMRLCSFPVHVQGPKLNVRGAGADSSTSADPLWGAADSSESYDSPDQNAADAGAASEHASSASGIPDSSVRRGGPAESAGDQSEAVQGKEDQKDARQSRPARLLTPSGIVAQLQ